MASMVREGRISPSELVRSHLRQIEARNPAVNAFVVVRAEEALAEARRCEAAAARGAPLGMLHGVPVTVKDSFDVQGMPTLSGSRLRAGHLASHDAGAVARLRAEGAIILGKTNCPEFLSTYETDNFVAGRTNNPWNLERTPGGSSGGEVAAVASFCSPGGIGSDGGGSIRVPAHFCGVAGLKPTPGRISSSGHFPPCHHTWGMLTVAGPIARTADDLRLLFSALAGYDSQDPFSAPVPLKAPELAGLRVGVMEQFYEVPVQTAVREAVRRAAGLLEEMRIPAEPCMPTGLERAPNLWWFFFGVLQATRLREMVKGREGEVHWTLLESLASTRDLPEPPAAEILAAFAQRDGMRADLLRQMEDHPVLLTPPCGITAFPHRTRRWPTPEKMIGTFQMMMPSTPWNVLGLPAVVIPMAVAEDGLPVGVQLVGRPWEEELLLDLAVKLEEARGPFLLPAG